MDRSAHNSDDDHVIVVEDEIAQNSDDDNVNHVEDEIRKLRMKFVFDISPVEIIDKEDDQDFIEAAAVENINQIDLVIHVIDHDVIYQYWSLKSEGDSLNLSSCCHHQHHRDHHHLRDDDDDEEMIMITCRPACPPEAAYKILVHRGVFASYEEDVNKNHAAADDDDYIMSRLHDLDILYESERICTNEQLEEVKRCMTQRISEAKPAVMMAKPKTVRIRVDLSTILKRYYDNPATAASNVARDERSHCAEHCAIHYPASAQTQSEMMIKPAALKSSRDALETKIFEKEDLILSSSCAVCLNEFCVGVDEIKKMPCSHAFHWTCLLSWLMETNTCPLCRYEIPNYWSKFEDQLTYTGELNRLVGFPNENLSIGLEEMLSSLHICMEEQLN